MLSENKINVFISYSWDSPAHQQWVLFLADAINKHGGNSIVDKQVKYGGHLRLFMERHIKAADVVLMVLTPNYKNKAQNLKGGVGYEYNIITKELFKVIDKNEKYIGVLRDGNHESSVPDFIEDFKYVDLHDGPDFEINLKELLEQILKVPLKQPEDNKVNKPVMENDYKDLQLLTNEMKSKAFAYFEKLFVGDNEVATKLKVTLKVQEWIKEVEVYNKEIVAKFNPAKMALAEDFMEDFKNNVFGKDLWTVKAALKTHDPDLARYKKDFRDADAEEIYNTVNGILTATHEYVKNTASKIKYDAIKTVADLALQYLDEEEMFMNKIIGFGIRSELLHRYYPAYFPIMTQKSLWAMYFICDSSKEFITIEQKNRQGIMRVSHNWQYPYDRFTYLMNELAIQFEHWVSKYKIKIDPVYRFGYINMFLSSIHELNKADIKLLHEWVETE